MQLGTCTRLNARISQRQCDINRNGLPYRPARNGQLPQAERQPCLSCAGCQGLGSLQTADVQLIVTPYPADVGPDVAPKPALSLPLKKRGVGARKRSKSHKTTRREVTSMPQELQQQIMARTLLLLEIKRAMR